MSMDILVILGVTERKSTSSGVRTKGILELVLSVGSCRLREGQTERQPWQRAVYCIDGTKQMCNDDVGNLFTQIIYQCCAGRWKPWLLLLYRYAKCIRVDGWGYPCSKHAIHAAWILDTDVESNAAHCTVLVADGKSCKTIWQAVCKN